MKHLAILGSGSWGTALAIVLSARFEQVTLWARTPEAAQAIAKSRENCRYLPGFAIPANVRPTADLAFAVRDAPIILSAVPSKHLRVLYEQLAKYVKPHTCFVSATKGIENESLLRMSQVIAETLGAGLAPRIAVLSGPTFAREVAAAEPAAVVVASEESALALQVQAAFSGPTLRLYTTHDVTGVEIGAAMKNVIAIGAGICHGLGLGGNSVAALVTRGLAELTRLAVALGGKARTLAGLAGLGDLVLTSTGDLSRNRFVGVELARGKSLHEILAAMTQVAEGVETCRAAHGLAKRTGIVMPITEAMYDILYRQKPVERVIRELMERPLTSE